ncbi:TRAP-type C4-dicarboxylate transport system, small permease component [Bhargavaea ginsengi]|uniref:TRAP-type C4-dicarboxylate transport system, small permease component n=1 Tax=Bhargavaea ginsengi TaxID=426757 RepID=A0A1H6USJ6_9BACL|nr:TRAP transporter small permease [Bhargavaea ginsengi]SEI90882.1 TRAP-type C4-dicarboxylate transport system, small permease component [Bhargavaea ginsengi]
MEKLEKGFSILEFVCLRISQVALLGMMLLTSLDAFSRYIFNQSITGAYEITEMYLMVITVFLSMSYVLKEDGHIRLDILFDRFSSKVQGMLNIIFYILGAALMIVIGYLGLQSTMEALDKNLVASGLIDFPLWLSYIWVPVGAFLIAIRFLILCVFILTGRPHGKPADEEVDIV